MIWSRRTTLTVCVCVCVCEASRGLTGLVMLSPLYLLTTRNMRPIVGQSSRGVWLLLSAPLRRTWTRSPLQAAAAPNGLIPPQTELLAIIKSSNRVLKSEDLIFTSAEASFYTSAKWEQAGVLTSWHLFVCLSEPASFPRAVVRTRAVGSSSSSFKHPGQSMGSICSAQFKLSNE